MAAEDVITAVSIAKEAGFEVTAEELQSLAGDEGDEERELTDEELSAASGGFGSWHALLRGRTPAWMTTLKKFGLK